MGGYFLLKLGGELSSRFSIVPEEKTVTAADSVMTAGTSTAVGILTGTVRKVRYRLLPLLLLLYVVAFLDRINIGFAAVTMNHALAITSAQFRLLTGIFSWSYCLFEVPSNLLLERIGARIWIARILVTWGVIAVLTGFVRSTEQLSVACFLLAAAEGWVFPWNAAVRDLSVRGGRAGADHRAVHGCNSCLQHHRRRRFLASSWVTCTGWGFPVGAGCWFWKAYRPYWAFWLQCGSCPAGPRR